MKNIFTLRFPSSAEILDVKVCASYLKSGVNVNLRAGDDNGHYPLALAAAVLDIDACLSLLAAGARPDSWKKGYGTPMTYAIRAVSREDAKQQSGRYKKMLHLCEILCGTGFDPCADDRYCPIDMAAALDFRELVVLLAKYGERANPAKRSFYSYDDGGRLAVGPDADIERALYFAHEFKNEDMIVRFLLLDGRDSKFRQDGLTPFQYFVTQGMDRVVEYYVRERGESLDQTSEMGFTLLQLAKKESTKKLLRALKREAEGVQVKPVMVGVHTVVEMVDGVPVERQFGVFHLE